LKETPASHGTFQLLKTDGGFFKQISWPGRISNKNLTQRCYSLCGNGRTNQHGKPGSRVSESIFKTTSVGGPIADAIDQENDMISKECNFSDFAGAVRGKTYFEILHLADQEATEAERLFLRRRIDTVTRQRCGREYAERIKQFIDYMRYEVRPRGKSTGDAEIFASFNPERRPRRGV
jgi:hypothetical protein